uniref:Uncharacterized protein n=1 Tax=Pithovirus LCPAC401 TaxID=2506595 RepID=A0A481ZA34_9VIRU|nr:MAG: hypothetical protein LCPAC401_04060 [Pithovirus LCPAC401]
MNCNGKDNHLSNLEAVTHSQNIRITIDKGLSERCIKIRRHNHDDTYVDYISVKQASDFNDVNVKKLSRISLKGVETAGMCKCGKRFLWTRIEIRRDNIIQTSESNNNFHTETRIDNYDINIKEVPETNNVLTITKSKIKIRRHNHDGTHVDYTSIKQASKLNSVPSLKLIKISRRGVETAGMCKCGEKFLWTRSTG